ncbi:GALNT1 [Bugula neritina]|uniref:GALNT1 n=1 Tax=Bugula neritina TaxID=10212 RepID=A0A7J7IU40_BUGNE|nr:GALNT1 [Bugula neritina]
MDVRRNSRNYTLLPRWTHIQKRSPYKWKDGENVVRKNSIRLAEVWMDDYKHYYYERINNDLGNFGDISSRKELRKKLNCKSFDWYIKNVFPELFIPDEAIFSGEIRNRAIPHCVDSPADHHAYNKPVKMWPCHNQGGNQYWLMSDAGEIRRDEACIDYTGSGTVNMYMCHGQGGNQKWQYKENGLLLHVISKQCMEANANGDGIVMSSCDPSVDRQLWEWKKGKGKKH